MIPSPSHSTTLLLMPWDPEQKLHEWKDHLGQCGQCTEAHAGLAGSRLCGEGAELWEVYQAVTELLRRRSTPPPVPD